MSRILHIITHNDGALSADVIRRQRDSNEITATIADLTSADPNYSALLDEIFEADSVQLSSPQPCRKRQADLVGTFARTWPRLSVHHVGRDDLEQLGPDADLPDVDAADRHVPHRP